jgi:hypothetical protein
MQETPDKKELCDDEDENTVAKSIVDEIIRETECPTSTQVEVESRHTVAHKPE